MKFTYEWKEYEYRGELTIAYNGDYVLWADGVRQFTGRDNGDKTVVPVPIVHPVERLHTFGGVVFRETGEVTNGMLRTGQVAILDTGNVVIASVDIDNPDDTWTILEPIRIETK